jgi:hypothetical protein
MRKDGARVQRSRSLAGYDLEQPEAVEAAQKLALMLCNAEADKKVGKA